MRPEPGQVLHFSEDPTITRFVPHVAATAQQPEAYVWAVDTDHAPSYWFPRDCPRMLTWAGPRTTAADRDLVLGPNATRVHAIEFGWLDRMRTTTLYAYRFAAGSFHPIGEYAHAQVATVPVEPLGPPEPVGDLLAAHERAGIHVRLVPDLTAYVEVCAATTVSFSGIRLRNARGVR